MKRPIRLIATLPVDPVTGSKASSIWCTAGISIRHIKEQKFRPGFIPKTLHWFKWEATFTWLSGFVLMILLYYATNGIYMMGPESPIKSPLLAVGVSLATLFGSWFVYDFFWQTSFAEKSKTAATGTRSWPFAGSAGCYVFYLRAAAPTSTSARCSPLSWCSTCGSASCRASRRCSTRRARAASDYSAGPKAKARSTHNSYLTLPVLFAMISNHFPLAYGSNGNWVVLILLCLLGGLFRHMMLQWNYGKTAPGCSRRSRSPWRR